MGSLYLYLLLVWRVEIDSVVRSADGNFEVSFKSNVLIDHSGGVMWVPCSIYKSSCTIDVNYFPFDEQRCNMSYGSWTYNSDEVRLKPYVDNFTKVDTLRAITLAITACSR